MIILCVVLSIIVLVLLGIGVVGYQEYHKASPAVDTPSEDWRMGALAEQMSETVEIVGALLTTMAQVQTELPGKVLQSIQGSINPRKGKVGELVTMLQLTSEYDRIIPLGQPVDMIGVSEDSIDFIEVKVQGGRLSPMEIQIRDLVEAGKVRFIVVRPNIEIGGSDD